jgi:hypothetical protein
VLDGAESIVHMMAKGSLVHVFLSNDLLDILEVVAVSIEFALQADSDSDSAPGVLIDDLLADRLGHYSWKPKI